MVDHKSFEHVKIHCGYRCRVKSLVLRSKNKKMKKKFSLSFEHRMSSKLVMLGVSVQSIILPTVMCKLRQMKSSTGLMVDLTR